MTLLNLVQFKELILALAYAPDDLTEEQKKANGVKDGPGIFVTGVATDGAAKAAGLQKGDFITKINDVDINSGPQNYRNRLADINPAIKLMLPM